MKFACLFVNASMLLLMCGCQQKTEVAQGDGRESAQQQDGSSGNWASDAWNDAVSSGSQAVDNTGDWISKLYQSAVDQGATSAKSVQEWVTDDWNAQGDWQYQIVNLPSSDVAAIETALNKAGTNRWECFHVDTSGDNWTFFLKRSRRSYLSRVPLRDLVNVVPALSG
ncbi:MAG: hypothetical protein ACR2NP_17670, partial [Pirellulaceae bacterium]